MGIIQELETCKIVAIDTSALIYYIEKHEKYFPILNKVFDKCGKSNDFKLITSSISIIEVLSKPLKEKREDLVHQYEDILLFSDNVYVIVVDTNIAKQSANLRAKYNFLRTPDAIQIATAIYASAEYFLSNDKKLKNIEEIKCLVLDELLVRI